jgi:hypothetical protein
MKTCAAIRLSAQTKENSVKAVVSVREQLLFCGMSGMCGIIPAFARKQG